MTLEELAEKVRAMRSSQTGFFRSTDPALKGELLKRAKAEEREVDRIVKDILDADTGMFGESQ